MKRVWVLTLVVTLIASPSAFAAESLMQSAKRVTQEMTRTGEATLTVATVGAETGATATSAAQSAGLSESGLGKGRKILIGLAIAVAFAAIVYKVDHSVEDNTPSSKGERLD